MKREEFSSKLLSILVPKFEFLSDKKYLFDAFYDVLKSVGYGNTELNTIIKRSFNLLIFEIEKQDLYKYNLNYTKYAYVYDVPCAIFIQKDKIDKEYDFMHEFIHSITSSIVSAKTDKVFYECNKTGDPKQRFRSYDVYLSFVKDHLDTCGNVSIKNLTDKEEIEASYQINNQESCDFDNLNNLTLSNKYKKFENKNTFLYEDDFQNKFQEDEELDKEDKKILSYYKKIYKPMQTNRFYNNSFYYLSAAVEGTTELLCNMIKIKLTKTSPDMQDIYIAEQKLISQIINIFGKSYWQDFFYGTYKNMAKHLNTSEQNVSEIIESLGYCLYNSDLSTKKVIIEYQKELLTLFKKSLLLNIVKNKDSFNNAFEAQNYIKKAFLIHSKNVIFRTSDYIKCNITQKEDYFKCLYNTLNDTCLVATKLFNGPKATIRPVDKSFVDFKKSYKRDEHTFIHELNHVISTKSKPFLDYDGKLKVMTGFMFSKLKQDSKIKNSKIFAIEDDLLKFYDDYYNLFYVINSENGQFEQILNENPYNGDMNKKLEKFKGSYNKFIGSKEAKWNKLMQTEIKYEAEAFATMNSFYALIDKYGDETIRSLYELIPVYTLDEEGNLTPIDYSLVNVLPELTQINKYDFRNINEGINDYLIDMVLAYKYNKPVNIEVYYPQIKVAEVLFKVFGEKLIENYYNGTLKNVIKDYGKYSLVGLNKIESALTYLYSANQTVKGIIENTIALNKYSLAFFESKVVDEISKNAQNLTGFELYSCIARAYVDYAKCIYITTGGGIGVVADKLAPVWDKYEESLNRVLMMTKKNFKNDLYMPSQKNIDYITDTAKIVNRQYHLLFDFKGKELNLIDYLDKSKNYLDLSNMYLKNSSYLLSKSKTIKLDNDGIDKCSINFIKDAKNLEKAENSKS